MYFMYSKYILNDIHNAVCNKRPSLSKYLALPWKLKVITKMGKTLLQNLVIIATALCCHITVHIEMLPITFQEKSPNLVTVSFSIARVNFKKSAGAPPPPPRVGLRTFLWIDNKCVSYSSTVIIYLEHIWKMSLRKHVNIQRLERYLTAILASLCTVHSFY